MRRARNQGKRRRLKIQIFKVRHLCRRLPGQNVVPHQKVIWLLANYLSNLYFTTILATGPTTGPTTRTLKTPIFIGSESPSYGKHLGHARFDTNSAPLMNAECKDPGHHTKYSSSIHHRERALSPLRNFDITKGSERTTTEY